jgi:hypothetical protein
MKTFFGLVALGWATIGTVAGLVYLLYLAAGSWERLGMWGMYLLTTLIASWFALIIGANVWWTKFMDVRNEELPKYRRFQPWLDERKAKRERKAKARAAALKQDGQLSETTAEAGQVSFK